MRIAILGAGASGGHFAYRLAKAGHDVCVVARGAHLDAMRKDGLRFEGGDETGTISIRASDNSNEFGHQDLVIVAVKATGLASMPPLLKPLAGPETAVLFPQNGMPWWYPAGEVPQPFKFPDLPIFRLGKEFLEIMSPRQIIGGTIYSGNEVRQPGVIFNSSPGRNFISFSEITPDGSEFAAKCLEIFDQSGIEPTRTADARAAMWEKLMQNMSGSVIALTTKNRTSISREDPKLGEIYTRIIEEGKAISAAWGYPVELDPAEALSRAPHHRPSLLQDYEQGRRMEIGEIVLAPAAFALAAGVPSPTLDAVAAIAARLAKNKGLFNDG